MKLILYSGSIPHSSQNDINSLLSRENPKLLILPSDSTHPKTDMYASDYQRQFTDLKFGDVDVYKFDQFAAYQSGMFDSYHAVFLSGGDTERFWEKLVKTHTHTALLEFVRRGGVLIGLSAGSMIMMSHILPNKDTAPAGLGLIPGYLHPHYDAPDLPALLTLSQEKYTGIIYGFPDDTYLVIDDTEQIFRGPYTRLKNGTIF